MKKRLVIALCAIGIVAIVGVAFLILNGKTYTATFEIEKGKRKEIFEVKKNETVSKITEPTKEGYTFIGWYIGEEEYDFSTKVTGDIILTAKWEKELEEDEVSIIFDSDGGSEVETTVIKTGEKVTKPTNPTKTNYIFVEWQLDGDTFDFSTKIDKNIKLVAKWKEDETVTIKKYTVTFDSNGGSAVINQTISEGSVVTKPSNPTKENYNFVEWQLNNRAYSFSTKVTSNITLKATWREKDKVTVTFDSAGGSSVTSRQVYKENTLGALPANPTKTGFTFDGWYNSNTKYTSTSVINSAITLTAKWLDNDELALASAKDVISNSYEIITGGQVIAPTYTGCTIVHSNPDVIAKITRDVTDANVTLNFNITCGEKNGTKTATGIIKASPYTYVATANGNDANYDLLVKDGNTTIANSGEVFDLNEEYLSDLSSGAAIINNADIVGFPNYKLLLSNDTKTIYVIKKK